MILFIYSFLGFLIAWLYKAFIYRKMLIVQTWKESLKLSVLITGISTAVGLLFVWICSVIFKSTILDGILGFVFFAILTEYCLFYFMFKRRNTKDYLACSVANIGSYLINFAGFMALIVCIDSFKSYRHEQYIKQWNHSELQNDLTGYVLFKGRKKFQEYLLYSFKEKKIIYSFVLLKSLELSCIKSIDLSNPEPKIEIEANKSENCREISFRQKIQIPNTEKEIEVIPYSIGKLISNYIVLSNPNNPDDKFLISKDGASRRALYLESLTIK